MKQEDKLKNRLIYKLTGKWPQGVIEERLYAYDREVRKMQVRARFDALEAQGDPHAFAKACGLKKRP